MLTAAVLSQFILVLLILFSLSGHNDAAVQSSFRGELSEDGQPEYWQHLASLQQYFAGLESAANGLTSQMEGGSLDVLQIKAVYYALLFGSADLGQVEDQAFVEQFVRREKRIRTVTSKDGEEIEEMYTVVVQLASLPDMYANLAVLLGRPVTEAEQVNAAEIEHRARYGTGGRSSGFDPAGRSLLPGAKGQGQPRIAAT